jgi:CBS domain-containing protein
MQLHSLVGGAAEIIGPEATLAAAAAGMVDESADCLAVVDGRDLVGIITERDLVLAICEGVDPDDEVVSAWMSEAPDTFAPDVMVREAVAWLMETGYRHLPVMADGELLGIVGIRDLLWALAQDS